jgi:hypothetical protein
MKVMRPEQARDFYEEDEDPARIEAIFDTGEKGYTAPPRGLRVRQLRERAAAALRLMAQFLESNSGERRGMRRPPGARIGAGRRTRSRRW